MDNGPVVGVLDERGSLSLPLAQAQALVLAVCLRTAGASGTEMLSDMGMTRAQTKEMRLIFCRWKKGSQGEAQHWEVAGVVGVEAEHRLRGRERHQHLTQKMSSISKPKHRQVQEQPLPPILRQGSFLVWLRARLLATTRACLGSRSVGLQSKLEDRRSRTWTFVGQH